MPTSFTIDGGVLAFREPPNYEDPQSATVGVPLAGRKRVPGLPSRAGGGTHEVAVTVTDVDEAGMASIDRAAAAGIPPAWGQPVGRGRGGGGREMAVG